MRAIYWEVEIWIAEVLGVISSEWFSVWLSLFSLIRSFMANIWHFQSIRRPKIERFSVKLLMLHLSASRRSRSSGLS